MRLQDNIFFEFLCYINIWILSAFVQFTVPAGEHIQKLSVSVLYLQFLACKLKMANEPQSEELESRFCVGDVVNDGEGACTYTITGEGNLISAGLTSGTVETNELAQVLLEYHCENDEPSQESFEETVNFALSSTGGSRNVQVQVTIETIPLTP